MGLFSNTVNLTTFKITDDSGFLNEIDDGQGSQPVILMDRLAANRFTPIDNTPVEVSLGWTGIMDPADTEFQTGSTWIGDYLTFSLRRDCRKVPASVLRAKVDEACKTFLAESPGFSKVPKQKKQDITDACREKLLAMTLPVPTVYDVSWHLPSNTVSFFNLSGKAVETFYDLFKKSFPELGLRLITPYDRASDICTNMEQQDICDALAQANKAGSDSVLALMKENEWIGFDFFAWLLYITSEGLLDTELSCWIDHKITVAVGGENAQKISFTGDQSKLKEVKTALSEGKQIGEARIFLQNGDGEEWSFNLKGQNFNFASFRCPAVKLEKDDTTDALMERQAVFLERQHLMEKGRGYFEDIFREFLKVRLSKEWGHTLVTIEEWWREA